MRALKEACKDLVFNADVVDKSETPDNEDVKYLLDSIDECREIIRLLEAKEKTFIFLTIDGTTQDGTGADVENCQMLAIAKGEDALTAYNSMLNSGRLAGQYDTCFCYELTSENMAGFDLISHNGMSDKSCPDCDETLCEDMSDNKLFCTECGYEEPSDNKDDMAYHCDKCGKAIGLSDYEVGQGLCLDCIAAIN